MLLPSALPCDDGNSRSNNNNSDNFIQFPSLSPYYISPAQAVRPPPTAFPLLALAPARPRASALSSSIHQSLATQHHHRHRHQLQAHPLQTTSLSLPSIFATPISPPGSRSNNYNNITTENVVHDSNRNDRSSSSSNILAPRPHLIIPRSYRPHLHKSKFANPFFLPTPPRTPTPTLPLALPAISTSTKPPPALSHPQSGITSKKRRRASSSSSSTSSDIYHQPTAPPPAPSTPKRRRLAPPCIPLGLESADFVALENPRDQPCHSSEPSERDPEPCSVSPPAGRACSPPKPQSQSQSQSESQHQPPQQQQQHHPQTASQRCAQSPFPSQQSSLPPPPPPPSSLLPCSPTTQQEQYPARPQTPKTPARARARARVPPATPSTTRIANLFRGLRLETYSYSYPYAYS